MITVEDYFGPWLDHEDATGDRKHNALELVAHANALATIAQAAGVEFKINPHTKTCVGGETYGGFRPQDCPIGASHSAHKEGLAVDLYDPLGEIDDWCVLNQVTLREHGIYIEFPGSTHGWSHWTIRAPKSGNTVFFP